MASAQGRAGSSLLARLKGGIDLSFMLGRSYVGLSIGASSVKLVELRKKSNSWMMTAYANIPVEEVISDQREVVNAANIAYAIQEALTATKVKSKEVCSSLVGSGVIIKNITISVNNKKELEDQVYWEAEQYIPFDINDVVIDYQTIREIKKNEFEVVVVAVKNDYIDQYLGVIEEAGLQTRVMDVEVFALQNCFESNYTVPSNEAVLIADIGAMSTKVTICADGSPLFTKDAPYGGINVTNEIQRELKLPTFVDAETLKISETLPQEVSEIVSRMCHVLGTELKRSIDFYNASNLGPPVSTVYLSGGGSRAQGMLPIVQEYVGVPVQVVNPFERIQGDPKKMSQEYLDSIAPEAVIPIGLAIRARDKTT
jgi:type IV pilus assembly protein PilM